MTTPAPKSAAPGSLKVKTPTKKLLELRRRGLSYEEIASLTDLTKQSVWERLKRTELDDLDLVDFRKRRLDLLDSQQAMLLASFDPETIAKAGLLQRVTAFGIHYGKARLERGASTANLSMDMTLEVLQRRALQAICEIEMKKKKEQKP